MIGLAQFVLITVILAWLALSPDLIAGAGLSVLVVIALSYLSSLHMLVIDRSDEPIRGRIVTFLLAPLGMFWTVFPARVFRLYGMLTFARTEWGTRVASPGE